MEKLLRLLMDRARKLSPEIEWGTISVVLTDNSETTRLNILHLSRTETTDVISFRYLPVPGETHSLDGELIINVERAVEMAQKTGKEGWDASRELALYMAHGCDHLMDETDYDAAGRRRMRRRELEWLHQLEDSGIIKGLVRV